jgi:virginiamycin B lyase
LWFTEGFAVGQVSTQGAFSTVPLPVETMPWGITAGPHQQLWFPDEEQNRVFSLSLAGTYTLYPIPSYGSLSKDIVTGPDGNLWFTENRSNQIGCLIVS